MNDKEKKAASKSSAKTGRSYYLLSEVGVNRGAAATTLSYLSDHQFLGVRGKWIEDKCPDGTKARVLKNPEDAFELYANEWSTKFDFVVKLLKDIEAKANVEVKKNIVKLFENLNYVNAALREMYKNSYLTFAANACSPVAQMEKQRMDRAIAVIGLSLISFKMILESGEAGSIEKANSEILKLIDKITEMLLRQ